MSDLLLHFYHMVLEIRGALTNLAFQVGIGLLKEIIKRHAFQGIGGVLQNDGKRVLYRFFQTRCGGLDQAGKHSTNSSFGGQNMQDQVLIPIGGFDHNRPILIHRPRKGSVIDPAVHFFLEAWLGILGTAIFKDKIRIRLIDQIKGHRIKLNDFQQMFVGYLKDFIGTAVLTRRVMQFSQRSQHFKTVKMPLGKIFQVFNAGGLFLLRVLKLRLFNHVSSP
ncbi:MAG: hypothetical protein IH923_11700 [Nitrospinae bacterium]|nr:hypothetical protein [Nitrospinota bacterium]